jgi:methionyl-tRNA formyltransferase
MNKEKINFAFFGTDNFSVFVLEELKNTSLVPSLIITAPDREKNRGQKLLPCEVKIWAEKNNLEFIQPEEFNDEIINFLKAKNFDFFCVASYGKIIPQKVLNIPLKGNLNVHPSLLPKHRGASPIETAMLNDELETGVTIMLMDEKMDHGPILMQKECVFTDWPNKNTVEEILARLGGQMLAEVIVKNFKEQIQSIDQNHELATFTKKIEKKDGLIDWNDSDRKNFLKIQAFNPWPGAYFFHKHLDKEIRIKITSAKWQDNKLQIEKVIPEGRHEMTFSDFCRGFNFEFNNI